MSENGTHRVVYPMEAFDGGLNSKYAQNIIADNQSPDCLNVVFDDLGGIATRGGMSKFNTTSVGSFAGDGLFTPRFNDGTEKLVGFWNGTGYAITGTSTFTTIGSAQSVWTAGSRVDATMYQNLMFFGNAYSQPYKYNGTDFTRHGITKPNSTAASTSGTAGANGAQTGDVNYVITYVNSYSVESDISPVTTTLNVASTATVSLTALPLAPQSFGVSARRLYRRDAGTASTYKRVAVISDNTTTTYLDSIPVASLGVAAPTDQGEPPVWKFCVAHQERLWAAKDGDSILYYSELTNPFVFKAANTIPIADGDGEVITGLAVHANMLAVFKSSSVWLIYMPDTTPGNWIRVKSKSKYGAASHFAQADYQGLRMFIGQRYGKLAGFMSLAGDDTQQNAVDLAATKVQADSESDVIEPEAFLISTTGVPKACAIEYKNKLWFSIPSNNSTNNRVLQFDYTRRTEDKTSGSWVPFTYPHGFNAFAIYGGLLYAQSATAHGFVYKLDTSTYSDDGTAIDSYAWTKEFYGYKPHMENWKDFRFANLIVETLGSYYMNVVYRADASSGAGTTVQVSLTPGGSVWGVLVWGSGTWGANSSRANVTVPFGTLSGKRVEMKFSNQNTLNQGFHVYPNASFTYNLRGKR